jgi:polyphosphate glucokinase
MLILGVDIGGSGIKAAVVDTLNGVLMTSRHRIETPQPATPEAVATVLAEMVRYFNWTGVVGCGFPAVVLHGVCKTASIYHLSLSVRLLIIYFLKEQDVLVFALMMPMPPV